MNETRIKVIFTTMSKNKEVTMPMAAALAIHKGQLFNMPFGDRYFKVLYNTVVMDDFGVDHVQVGLAES